MKIVTFFWAILISAFVQAQIIITVAGNGTPGYSGDGGPATSGQLTNPFGVAADNNGNIFIADAFNNVIRKVNSSGVITTVAGTGAVGYTGDGGLATTATLYRPYHVAIDNANNIYITDQLESVIRKVNSAGIISTITGNLPGGYSGDGGPLIQAQFGSIEGISFDNANNLYITDFTNGVIRKVNSLGIISTFAGNGMPGFSGDGGLATAARIRTQTGVAIDNTTNNVYIADPIDNRIRVVYPSGVINTFAGTGVAGYSGDGGPINAATMNYPWQISIDLSGNLYVVDYYNYVIRKIDNTGIISTYAGNGTNGYSGDGGPAIQAQLTDPCGIANDNAGNTYIVQRTSQVVRKITTCLAVSIIQQPSDVALCNSGNALFAINATGATVFQWQENSGTGWLDLTNTTKYSGTLTNTLNITNATLSMNGYQYRCKTSNSCGIYFSSPATLSVAAPSMPALSITTVSATICAGSAVMFTANAVNGGTAPTYQWKINGINTGSNTPTYTTNTLATGDIISCLLTSNANCAVPPTAASNNITMNVNPVVSAFVVISSSLNNICFGTPVTFNAVASNGGSSPLFQWKKNGANVGTNSPTYTDNALGNGDIIACILTSNQGCLISPGVNSNSIGMQVFQNPVVALDKTKNLCIGNERTLDAGNYSSYLWSDGSTGRYLIINTVGNYYVTVTDNNGCEGSDTSKITTLSPPPKNFLPMDTSFCLRDSLTINARAGYINYLWNDNSNTASLTVGQPGLYWLDVKDQNGCMGQDSILVSGKNCPKGFYIPNAFTPNNDGMNDYFRPLIFGNTKKFKFIVYNRWGQIVFQSNDKTKGWDGYFKGIKQDGNVFVWICDYQLENEQEKVKSGTVLIVR